MESLVSHPGDETKDVARIGHRREVWRLRDTLAAAFLFLGSAAFVWWQNSRVAVLWDLGYLLDTSWRIALGQIPYRDFPLVHAPGTFLIQAMLIKVLGRHYFLPVMYAAVAGGLGSVIAWRVALRILSATWWTALVLSAPLIVAGVYAIYPSPIYDGDCALAILLALWCLENVDDAQEPVRSQKWKLPMAGAICVLPLIFKQNMGLPFLAVVATALFVLILTRGVLAGSLRAAARSKYAGVLIGIVLALGAVLVVTGAKAGLHNCFYWTVTFAGQRRMPGLGLMLSVYAQPALMWTVPALCGGVALCSTRWIERKWAKWAAAALMAAPFVGCMIDLLLQDNAEDRADVLLSIWPLWLIAALAVAAWSLRRGITFRRLLPFVVLAAIHGTLMSQQLWGSTYAIWPFLIVLIAGVLTELPSSARPVGMTTAIAACLVVGICGGMYAASLDRLNYVAIPEGPVVQASTHALRGMATPGPYLADFDELVAYTEREIPRNEAILPLPGEGPFFYATGRVPRFPVTLFDPTTDPYSQSQVFEQARQSGVRWVIVQRVLQSKENVMPAFDETMRQLQKEFTLDRRLAGYDVYRRK